MDSIDKKVEKEETVQETSETFADALAQEIEMAGGEFEESEEFEGAIGRTMYDTPTSKDNTITVLLPADRIANVPAQSLVRIKSRPKEKGGDGRQYLGAVVEGPFAEPDGLRADAPIVVTTTVRGAMSIFGRMFTTSFRPMCTRSFRPKCTTLSGSGKLLF